MNDEASRTVYVGNLHSDITEEILYELFLQAGPISHVKIPQDKATNKPKSFGFVCYKDEVSAPYALYLLDDTQLFGRPIKVQRRNNELDVPSMDCVGVHSLDPDFQMKKEEYNFTKVPALLPTVPQLSHTAQVPYYSGLQLSGGIQLPYGYNTPPVTIETGYINDFKNMLDNSYNYGGYNNYSNYQNNSSTYNYQYNQRDNSQFREQRYDGRSQPEDRYRQHSHSSSSRFEGRLSYGNTNESQSHYQDRHNKLNDKNYHRRNNDGGSNSRYNNNSSHHSSRDYHKNSRY